MKWEDKILEYEREREREREMRKEELQVGHQRTQANEDSPAMAISWGEEGVLRNKYQREI